jgi:hypothetical protein
LANSLLTKSSTPNVSKLLSDLTAALRGFQASGRFLTPSLVSYVFFPLSTILRRNASADIPDQVLEKLLTDLAILCESWWWDCDIGLWEKIFMLCAAIIGGIDAKEHGKGKDRDDETKEAAAQCLWSLVHERTSEEAPSSAGPSTHLETRLAQFQAHVRTSNFTPVLGQTLNNLLSTSESFHIPLQRLSLRLLHVLISLYAPDHFIPSVLPGVVSSMAKVALGVSSGKGWANGELVAGALTVMQEVIVKSVGDGVCTRDGAIREVYDIEDLAVPAKESDGQDQTASDYSTMRTSAWLRGTSAQLHIALNTLTSLVSHPTPSALFALSRFSSVVLASCSLTLPQSRSLLLSFLMSLSISDYPAVSTEAKTILLQLLSPSSKVHQPLLQTLMQITSDNITTLPRMILSQNDRNVEHMAGMIESVCQLTKTDQGQFDSTAAGLASIAAGIGRLLGSTGGIEKWGWNLLSVLEFNTTRPDVSKSSAAQLLLDHDSESAGWVAFPEATLKNVTSPRTRTTLDRMFRSLGNAGGDSCLYAVDWFVDIGRSDRGPRGVAALWCACRLLEGIGVTSLDSGGVPKLIPIRTSRGVDKFARGLAKVLAELWDEEVDVGIPLNDPLNEDGDFGNYLPIERTTGTVSIRATVNFCPPTNRRKSNLQPILHKAFALQLLSVTAGILQARFTPLLLHTLYPVLHSLVSPVSHLSSTALATLHFITESTSYATPANLLLSNFDYALDAVSRRLSRRWLDVDASKVLVMLLRLVGGDVVERAGDVVGECFDRLDEFHGYEVIVEGLIEVLVEVIKLIATDEENIHMPAGEVNSKYPRDSERMDAFFDWLKHRHHESNEGEDKTDYGPAPREAWGESKGKVPDGQGEGESIAPDLNVDPLPTPSQALTKQITSRSLYFLTHRSPVIRARILTLLSVSASVLSESTLLPSIHHAWPFILNRLADSELFVVGAAAELIESLATHMGDFMFRKIWDDVWPRFRTMLGKLDIADASSALARKGHGAVGTESAYTHSHRLYRSLLRTMTAAAKGVRGQDISTWQVIVSFRRFLHSQAHEELQACARELYVSLSMNNEDAVWLALASTRGQILGESRFLGESKWDLEANVALIFNAMPESSVCK